MNDTRRKQIQKVIDALDDLNLVIQDIFDDEETAYDNLPESLQFGKRGEAMEDALDSLREAMGALQDTQQCLTYAQD